MDLRRLQIFCAIFEEASVSLAARRLSLSQPTVSEHLRCLEQELGVVLFDRLSRQLRPTRAGSHLYEQARQLGDLERSIAASLSRFLGKLEGRLHLGASSVPGEYLLPAVIGRFHERHPGVSLSLLIKDTRSVLEDLAAGVVDIGFVGARPPACPFETRQFGSDRLVVAVPTKLPWDDLRSVSLAELAALPLLLRTPGSGTRTSFEALLAEHELSTADLHLVAELGSAGAIKEAIKAGVGYSVVSDRSLESECAAGVIRVVDWRDVAPPSREFFAVTDSRRQASPVAEEFLALLEPR
ncbi:MAG: selenium metabolism-associated LysR family transcriptional regulator [Thermoanaerobaculia bacterium]|nr:selenium metabolism-associated LysR family transcriptional regulator [Thermoanaerobaculia bacterium]